MHWMNSKIHRISKGKKVNKLWRKLFDQHKVEFKSYVSLREKKKNSIISEMLFIKQAQTFVQMMVF